MPLYNSLYESALKQDIPRSIIDDLVRIFANDVDFQRERHRPATPSTAFYDEGDDADGAKELLYASITARGETYKLLSLPPHPTTASVDYYDPNGRSTRKFLDPHRRF